MIHEKAEAKVALPKSPARPSRTTSRSGTRSSAGHRPVGRARSAAGQIVARPAPANPASAEPCVTLYGDSFVYGDDDAWGNVLAGRLACRVDNFGIGGYGTDQALLRFMANESDRAPVTVLGIFADNLMRNVNQNRYFLTGGELFALKPRFVLDDGTLNLVPILDPSYEQFVEGLRRPERLWQHEVFLPDSRRGPVSWSFPYTVSALRLAMQERVGDFIQRKPSWIDFHRPAHDSHARRSRSPSPRNSAASRASAAGRRSSSFSRSGPATTWLAAAARRGLRA